MNPRSFIGLLLFISSALAVLMFIVPYLSPYGTFVDLDGKPGIIDHWDIWSGKDPLTASMYVMGDFLCHQQMSRTIILNGSEMPVCVRDMGLLIGFAIGCLVECKYFGRPFIYHSARVYIIVSFLLIFTDWLIQHAFDLNVPFTRMVTGLLAGAGFSLIIYCWIIAVVYPKKEDRS